MKRFARRLAFLLSMILIFSSIPVKSYAEADQPITEAEEIILDAYDEEDCIPEDNMDSEEADDYPAIDEDMTDAVETDDDLTADEDMTDAAETAFDLAPNDEYPECTETESDLLMDEGTQNIQANATSGKCGEYLTWKYNTSTAALHIINADKKSNAKMSDYSSASKVPWYSYINNIQTVIVDDGVYNIGNYSLSGMKLLTSIDLPTSIRRIGLKAFTGSGLQSISLPKNVLSIEDAAFQDCSDLYNVNLGKKLNFVGDYAFSNCTKLEKVSIPNTLTGISTSCFRSCNLKSIELPDSIDSIGKAAFYKCKSLSSVTITDNVSYIGKNAFAYTGLTSISLPGSIEEIPEGAFMYCSKLERAEFSNGLMLIHDSAFSNCTALNTINLPGTLIEISASTFNNCNELQNFYLKQKDLAQLRETFESDMGGIYINAENQVYYRGNEANTYIYLDIRDAVLKPIFDQLYTGSAITPTVQLTYEGKTLVQGTDYQVEYSDNTNCGTATIRIDGIGAYSCSYTITFKIGTKVSGTCGKYLTWTFDSSTDRLDIINTSSKKTVSMDNFDEDNIPPWYYLRSKIKMVYLPTGLKNISDFAFYRLKELTQIDIPDTVTAIGYGAFAETGLRSVTVPQSVKTLSKYAFASNYSLLNIVLNPGVTTIDECAFIDCKYLNSVYLPDTVECLGAYAFQDCVNLTSIKLPANLKTIQEKTFYGCSLLQSVEFPSSLTSIEFEAFKNSGVVAVIIPASVTTIGERAFYGCKSLKEVQMSGILGTIGPCAFAECTVLKSLTLPGQLEKLGGYFILNDSQLTDIYLVADSTDYLKKLLEKWGYGLVGINYSESRGYYTTCDVDLKIHLISDLAISDISEINDQVYTGSEIKPRVTVKFKGLQLSMLNDYTISYSNNTEIGTATATITGIGDCIGKVKKEFTIKPAKVKIKSICNSSSGITLTWSKVDGATGYLIYRLEDTGKYKRIKKITKATTLSCTDTGATKNGKKYTYKIVAYTRTNDDTIVNSDDSKTASCYRLSAPKISSITNTTGGIIKVKWTEVSKANGYELQYSTKNSFSSPNTVTITKGGTVSKKVGILKKGKTYYVRINAYKKIGSKKYYSDYSAVQTIKVVK